MNNWIHHHEVLFAIGFYAIVITIISLVLWDNYKNRYR